MTSPTPNMASGAMGRADAHQPATADAADAGPFVLNLCSSTTPMALAQNDLPELKRFTFFVSRRFEEGRERFRLHMGYFTTLAEAEEWLSVVREIYPGAWAGEAPGKKLRARAAAAAAAQAQHAVGPQPRSALPNLPPAMAAAASQGGVAQSTSTSANPTPASARPTSAPRVSAPVKPAPSAAAVPVARPAEPRAPAPAFDVPTVHAARPTQPPTPRARPSAAAPVPPVLTPPVVKPATAPQARVPVAKAAPPRLTPPPVAKVVVPPVPTAGARAQGGGVQPGSRPAVAPPATVAPTVTAAKTAAVPSRADNRQAPPPAKAPAAAHGANTAPAAASSKQRPKAPTKGTAFDGSNVREVLAALDDTGETGQTRMMPAPQIPHVEAHEDDSLSDTQVLRYLETRRDESNPGRVGDEPPDASISLLKPDDTGTRRALKVAVSQNAPVSFAVQLQWSVQPVELDKVPPLAIFSAYTLYTVEGSREGRKWYGLRLGFFSDAISAKQVAYYVRSEFSSVAVVPVSPQEKQRASDEDRKSGAAVGFPRKRRQSQVDEFKLIDSDEDAKAAQSAGAPAAKPAPNAARLPAPTPKRAPAAKAGRINARDRKGPQTLEETLEILGAGELEIENRGGDPLNDTGVRHLKVEVQKNTPFSRLLERLSERSKKT